MSKLLLPSLCLCLTVWLFGGSVWFGNQFPNHIEETGWQLNDGPTSFHSPTTFSFQISDADIILDENQLAMISKIAQYLAANPKRNLELVGVYTDEESENIGIKNLGLARATSFQQLIYKNGVDLNRISVAGKKVKNHHLNSNGLIQGGVDFTFIESPIEKYGTSFTMVKSINFEDQSAEKITTKDIDAYIAAIRQYLVDHPEKYLQLIGFSQAVQQNTLTQKRVLALKNILIKSGISIDKLKTTIDKESIQQSSNSYVEIRLL
jgi:hypothetical protein